MGKADAVQVPEFTADSPGYEADFYAWLNEQAARLRLLRVPGIDSENLAEEIESLGRSDKRELLSRSRVLLTHLLKWEYQPARRGKSWRSTILEQRLAMDLVLADSPSLQSAMPDTIQSAYRQAVTQAAGETGLPKATFPLACEWTVGQVLSPDFLPDEH